MGWIREGRLSEVTRLPGERGSERFCHRCVHTHSDLVDTRVCEMISMLSRMRTRSIWCILVSHKVQAAAIRSWLRLGSAQSGRTLLLQPQIKPQTTRSHRFSLYSLKMAEHPRCSLRCRNDILQGFTAKLLRGQQEGTRAKVSVDLDLEQCSNSSRRALTFEV